MGKIMFVEVIVCYVSVDVECIFVVIFGVKEICEVIECVCQNCNVGCCIILFVDEVYCFNKSQQDVFLLYIEDGIIIFIGVIMENFFFELNLVLLL